LTFAEILFVIASPHYFNIPILRFSLLTLKKESTGIIPDC